jgi:hypothetical protein
LFAGHSFLDEAETVRTCYNVFRHRDFLKDWKPGVPGKRTPDCDVVVSDTDTNMHASSTIYTDDESEQEKVEIADDSDFEEQEDCLAEEYNDER